MKRGLIPSGFAILFFLMAPLNAFAEARFDPVSFIKSMPYQQVVKEIALSRCLAQVSRNDKTFSLDAARTANALRNWIPMDINSGDEKINQLIARYKDQDNPSHSETSDKSKGVTLNCLRMYHSEALERLSREVIVGDASRNWYQDNSTK